MINILNCNNIDLSTLIEINVKEIRKLKNHPSIFPFMIGDINRLTKENEQINTLINHLTK